MIEVMEHISVVNEINRLLGLDPRPRARVLVTIYPQLRTEPETVKAMIRVCLSGGYEVRCDELGLWDSSMGVEEALDKLTLYGPVASVEVDDRFIWQPGNPLCEKNDQ